MTPRRTYTWDNTLAYQLVKADSREGQEEKWFEEHTYSSGSLFAPLFKTLPSAALPAALPAALAACADILESGWCR
jgi:hypothetical protein